MAIKATNKLIIIRDFFLNYDPGKFKSHEQLKVILGVWDSPDQAEFTLEQMQQLRSNVNKLIVQMSSDVNERKKTIQRRTTECQEFVL